MFFKHLCTDPESPLSSHFPPAGGLSCQAAQGRIQTCPSRLLVPNPGQPGTSPGSKPFIPCLAFHIPVTSGRGI